MLDWNDLRYAHAVAGAGSLIAAARALGVHQTTVGRRLDALESALGVRLFVRAVTGMTMTPDGARVLSSIDALTASLTRVEQGARGAPGSVRGLVRIAITETGARNLVEGVLGALLVTYPDLSLEIVPSNSAADLARGEADLAMRLVKPDDGLVAKRLGHVTYGLYASDRYCARNPLPLREGLAGHDVVAPSRELAGGPEARWLQAHASQARCRLQASSLATLAQAVAAGLGVCALPVSVADTCPEARLIRALPEIPPRPVWLVMHPEMRGIARVRAVAAAITAEMRIRLAPRSSRPG